MRLALLASLGVLVTGSIALGQAAPPAATPGDTIERPFAAGGHVRLQLASGEYVVRAGAADRVVVRWMPDGEARVTDLQDLSVVVQVAGSIATVVTAGPTKHVDFVIEIPARSDLHLRMRAGEIRLEGIDGHKDIRMTAGDLTIVVRPDSLASAHASVTFGDLDARALGISKSGIKRSLDWIGGGNFKLDARLGAGDLTVAETR